MQLAVLAPRPGTDRDDFAFLRLLFGRVGNDDAARGLLLRLDAADDHPVVQGTELHGNPPAKCCPKLWAYAGLLALSEHECQKNRRGFSGFQDQSRAPVEKNHYPGVGGCWGGDAGGAMVGAVGIEPTTPPV